MAPLNFPREKRIAAVSPSSLVGLVDSQYPCIPALNIPESSLSLKMKYRDEAFPGPQGEMFQVLSLLWLGDYPKYPEFANHGLWVKPGHGLMLFSLQGV